MFFNDIIGQKKIKEILIKTVNDNHISHALLFLGQHGSGKLALAIAYAQYISCTNKQPMDSCGECPSCRKYAKLIHPDLHFVFPVTTTEDVKKDPKSDDFISQWRQAVLSNPYMTLQQWYNALGVENKQGQIFGGESAEILRKLTLKTYESDYKIMIIWFPELMNHTAANKLLKILEEPPVQTVFLLVSESTEDILPTILSRTQIIRVPRIDDDSLREALQARFSLDENQLKETLHIAKGNVADALEHIKQSEDNNFNYESFIFFMRLCFQRKIADVVSWIESLSKIGREKQKGFLLYSLRFMRECFMMHLGQEQITAMASAEYEFAKKFSTFITTDNIFVIYEEINKAYNHVEMNANYKIVFFDLALKMMQLIKKK